MFTAPLCFSCALMVFSSISVNRVESSLMLRPTISWPVYLGIKHHLGITNRFLLLSDSCGFVDVERSLRREDGSVVYNCCWSMPAQSYSGPSPVGLATIFYCLRLETSLFVASYDAQAYGGGIRPRLHTGGVTEPTFFHYILDI
jgi:hypothetical protein